MVAPTTASYPASDNQGPMLLGVSYALYGLALLAFFVRIGYRLASRFRLTAADYTITASIVFKTASLGFATAAIADGFGRHFPWIGRSVGNDMFAVYMTGIPASCFARISIACLLLQFTQQRAWRGLLWATIVLQVLLFVIYDIVQLIGCNSVLMARVSIKQSQCLTPKEVWGFTYANIAAAMFSDLICATIPIFIMWRLSRSLVERILVCALMASSLLASAIGIPKLYFMATYDFSSPDGFYLMVPEFFWCRMEESIIIIAACAPLLKNPIERALQAFGIDTTMRAPDRELNEIRSNAWDSGLDTTAVRLAEQQARVKQQSDPERGDDSSSSSNRSSR